MGAQFHCQPGADSSELRCIGASHTAHSDLVLGGSETYSCHNSMGPLHSLHLGAVSEDCAWSQVDALREVRMEREKRD